MKEYFASKDYFAGENTIADSIDLSPYFTGKNNLNNCWINTGGWQSWNPGFEIESGKKQESLKCFGITQWNRYLVFPETKFSPSKNIVLAQFCTYLRWDSKYLFIVSTGNVNQVLPPVQFIFNRKTNLVSVELADKGKHWKKDDLQCRIEIFTAESYFDARDKLKKIFGTSDTKSEFYSSRFDSIGFLGKTAFGWESWYNHYADINEGLISEDLNALENTENFISMIKKNNILYKENSESQIVFQIDDGWENELGNWTINKERFPSGFKNITARIEDKKYVPGLWLAPFIIDSRTSTAIDNPSWLLHDFKNRLIPAGFNPLWGKKGTFYALDLSNCEVLDYLDSLMETVINEWGFRYIKLDFLYAGMFYGKFSKTVGKFDTAYEFYSNAIKILTKRKINREGKPVTYLGCGAPFELSFNSLPLSRIGCDTYENWENKVSRLIHWNGRNEAYLNLKDTIGHALWDKIIFANDPDVLFIRNKNCSLTKDEKILIAFVNSVFGSQIMYSDDPADSDSREELEIADEAVKIIEKFSNQEISVVNVSKDVFFVETKSKAFKAVINLGKKHEIKILENK